MTPVTKLLMLNLLTETWRGKGNQEVAHMPVLTEDGSPGGFLIFFGWVSEKRRKVPELSAEFAHRVTCFQSSQFCYINISLTNVSIWWASPGVVGEGWVKLRTRLQAWGRHGISIGHHNVWRQEPLLHRQNRADHREIFTLLFINHVKAKFRSESVKVGFSRIAPLPPFILPGHQMKDKVPFHSFLYAKKKVLCQWPCNTLTKTHRVNNFSLYYGITCYDKLVNEVNPLILIFSFFLKRTAKKNPMPVDESYESDPPPKVGALLSYKEALLVKTQGRISASAASASHRQTHI